jgi:GT2 family glycosyltransferase
VASGRDRPKRDRPKRRGDFELQTVHRSHAGSQYPTWVKNNRLRASDLARLRDEASGFGHKPLISVLLPAYNSKVGWLERALDSVLSQVYPNWELCVCDDGSGEGRVRRVLSAYERLDPRVKVRYGGENGGISAASNAALSMATGEFVALLDHDDELTPDALFEVVRLLQEHPDADFVYSDEDLLDEAGEPLVPHFKPDWSPDLLMSYNYITHLAVCRRTLVEEIGGFREGFEGSQDYDLFLRLAEKTDRIHHVPKVLYHWWRVEGSTGTNSSYTHERSLRALEDALERRGIAGSVEEGIHLNRFRVRYEVPDAPGVTVVIPTRDNVALLRKCIESIEQKTAYESYEILIVDNDSADPATVEYLASTPHRVLPFREEFNYARINNFAVSHASGEYVLLLNDDTEAVSDGWLEAMLEHARRPEVGAVGARLLYPDGRVQHAGVLVGVGSPWVSGVATHSHLYYPGRAPGYFDAAKVVRNYSAVTAACMMLRKSVFEEIGGFDEENLAVLFNDVDLCLRIREKGYRIVYTPYAELYHKESASRGHFSFNAAEFLYMRERWGEVLDHDPYYNPNFALDNGDFNLRADMLRPRALRERGREAAFEPREHPLEMAPADAQRYNEAQYAAARDSRRISLAPIPDREDHRSPAARSEPAPEQNAGSRDREAPS